MFWTGVEAKWNRLAVMAMVGFAAGSLQLATPAGAREYNRGENAAALPTVELSQLPREAQNTQRLILNGGPFPYPKDGIVFGNRERQLPPKARGYYHEYTVKTPGAGNRGARRIVCGGKPPEPPAACYYTDDHYASFRRIVQ